MPDEPTDPTNGAFTDADIENAIEASYTIGKHAAALFERLDLPIPLGMTAMIKAAAQCLAGSQEILRRNFAEVGRADLVRDQEDFIAHVLAEMEKVLREECPSAAAHFATKAEAKPQPPAPPFSQN